MNLLESITGNTKVSMLNDPFVKDKIVSISIHCFQLMNGQWSFNGKVKFKNGNTEGTHELEGTSIDDVYIKTANFVKSL